MKSLRVPAGVYVDGVAMGGRFVAPDMLGELVFQAEGDGPERLLALIFDRLDRAHAAYDRAAQRFDDDPKRFAQQRADAEQSFVVWRTVAQEAGEYGRKELDDLEREDESFAVEWEIGFDYDAALVSSDVDINLRIRRVDGAAMPQSEAKDVLSQFRDALAAGIDPVPPGYLMASINWRRPQHGGGWRPRDGTGTAHDLKNFNNPMYAHHNRDGAWDINPHGPVRMGSVKP